MKNEIETCTSSHSLILTSQSIYYPLNTRELLELSQQPQSDGKMKYKNVA